MTNFGDSEDSAAISADPGTDINDYNSAMRMRDIVVNIVTGLINSLRPQPQLGRVQTIDPVSKTATVLLANATQAQNFRWITSSAAPNQAGDLVEVTSSNGNMRISKLVYSALGDPLVDGHYVGEVITGSWINTPPGTLQCDGSAISRATYARLFAAIGTQNGVGDGSTTFNLPDYMGIQDSIPKFPLSGVPTGTKGGGFSHAHTHGTLAAAVHAHPLSDNGQAEISLSAGTPGGFARLVNTAASWVAGRQISGAGATSSTSVGNGAALTGSTDNSSSPATVTGTTDTVSQYPPWQGAMVVIKY